MAVTLRLKRAGTNKRAFFHLVVTDSRTSPKGRFIEKLGHYDPKASPPVCRFNQERVNYWLSMGAQASRTVSQLLNKYGQTQEVQGEKNATS